MTTETVTFITPKSDGNIYDLSPANHFLSFYNEPALRKKALSGNFGALTINPEPLASAYQWLVLLDNTAYADVNDLLNKYLAQEHVLPLVIVKGETPKTDNVVKLDPEFNSLISSPSLVTAVESTMKAIVGNVGIKSFKVIVELNNGKEITIQGS